MTELEKTDRLTKKEIIRMAASLDEKRQAQMARQVDSINRLLGHVQDSNNPNPVALYEHELMTLNEQLGLGDIRRTNLEATIVKIRQRCRDRNGAFVDAMAVSILEDIEKVMPHERPDHVGTTGDSDPVPELDVKDDGDGYEDGDVWARTAKYEDPHRTV